MSKPKKEADGVLILSADAAVGWSLEVRSKKPIEKLDPKKIQVWCDEYLSSDGGFTLMRRTKDGFVFYNGDGFFKIKWADVIRRFNETKPKVVYHLTESAYFDEGLPAKKIRRPANLPEGRFDNENKCFNQDPLWGHDREED